MPLPPGGGPRSSTLLRQLGCPSEPCQLHGHHGYGPGDSSAHRGHAGRSLHHLVRLCPHLPLDGDAHSYSLAFTRSRKKVPDTGVWGGEGSAWPGGRGFRGMRFFWPCPGELPAPPARGQGYFEISVKFMTGRPRTWPKRADKYLPGD